MGRKKKKKAIAKRRTQSGSKKSRKSKPKQSHSAYTKNSSYTERPPLADIETPDGYRAISASQAVIEYAQPLIDQIENTDINELNNVMKIGTAIWNYEISIRKPELKQLDSKNDIISRIRKEFGYSEKEALDLFESMLDRKEYLFPAAIQPDNPLIDFIRKETDVQVGEFDYGQLNFPKEPILPAEEDHDMINAIRQMDKYIANDTDYDDWEEHFFAMKEKCQTRYRKWLIDKGLKDYSDIFSENITTYLDFIYLYTHDDTLLLSNIKSIYTDEFFSDFILRKLIAKPDEYITCPPALKFFYTFLSEKGYLKDPKPFIKIFDTIEPHFLEVLKKRYES